jgi:hypothetical protein
MQTSKSYDNVSRDRVLLFAQGATWAAFLARKVQMQWVGREVAAHARNVWSSKTNGRQAASENFSARDGEPLFGVAFGRRLRALIPHAALA